AGPTGRGTSGCAEEVTLSLKGAKSATRSRRSTGTKGRMGVGRMRKPRAALEQQLERYRRELAEAREQQRATADILSVISSLPADVQPVFATIGANFVLLFGSGCGNICPVD